MSIVVPSCVSIITPCYNSEKWIKRYLDNILSQTYKSIQLILVNDGSNDKTEEIIKSYVVKFQVEGMKITYKYQENGGIGAAVNTALKLVEGEFFTWCDSDNFYAKEYIKKKVDFLYKNPQYAVVRCDGYYVKDDKQFTIIENMAKNNDDKFNENLFQYALEERNFHFGCAMVRTEKFEEVNPKREIYPSRYGQNWQILLPVFYAFKTGYIDEPLFYCVQRNDSISAVNRNNGYLKEVEQLRGYDKLLFETIESISIPKEKKIGYFRMVKEKYARKVLEIASNNKDATLADESYKTLKSIKTNRIKDWFLYIRAKSSFIYALCRFYGMVKRDFEKIV